VKRLLLGTAAALILAAAVPGGAGAADLDPIAQHQQALLAELNRARWGPAAWGEAHGINLSRVLPQPPLALNPELTGSANFKAGEMAEHDYFAHLSPVTGKWPNQLAIEWGYPLHSALGVYVNTIESIACGGLDPLPSLLASHHREHLLEWEHLEIGVGFGFDPSSSCRYHWAIHTGYRAGSTPVSITGTVFDDLDGDGIMDPGEGLPGVTITVEGVGSVVTNEGGGYSIAVPPGRHLISASGPRFRDRSSAVVVVGEFNVGADFISGVTAPVVRDYQLCFDRPPTILGTSGDDVIYGTDRRDVIHGLGGNDVIYGLGGNDFICGGPGRDVIRGGPGRDRIDGGPGRDRIFGNGGDDRILGRGGNDVIDGGWGTDVINGGFGFDTCLNGEILRNCESTGD